MLSSAGEDMTRDQEDLGEANIRIMKPFECKLLMMIKHKLSSEIRESSANFILFYFNIHIINKKYIEYRVSH